MTAGPSRSYRGRPIATPASLEPTGGRLRSLLVRVFDRLVGPRLGLESGRAGRAKRLRRFDASPSTVSAALTESLERVPADEARMVSRLMDSLSAARREQPNSPPAYLPGADWKRIRDADWAPYLAALDRGDSDVFASFARNFFRNEGLTGFWGGVRMFESFDALDGVESIARAEEMQRRFDTWREMFPDVATAELAAPLVGNPWGYLVDGQLVYEPMCEYHYHAQYARQLLHNVPSPVVLEIGGGFGGLAYQLMKNGTDVKYIGLDLPESIFLQSYYLASALPHLRILTFDSSTERVTAEDLADYDVVLMPNFMLPRIDAGLVDLAINVRSLSEMPADTIREYHEQLDRVAGRFIFHENLYKARRDDFHGIPSSKFPALENFRLVAESESRWPANGRDTAYPCHEYLYLHRSALEGQRPASPVSRTSPEPVLRAAV